MTGPYGGSPWGSPGPVGGRRSRWLVLGLPVALAGLAVLVAAIFLLLDGRSRSDAQPVPAVAAASPAPSSALEGKWTGEGSLIRCAGFEEDCSGSRSITLTVDCSPKRCAVTPFDRRYGSPPLRFEDGVYRAAGPVPPEVAPTCGGVPAYTALWRLQLILYDGQLRGSYAESTVQSFDCGATGLAWDVTLDRP